MKKLLCFSLVLFTAIAFAQVDVQGTVTMGEAQEPVAYAEISSVTHPAESTFTDADGYFTLHLSEEEGELNVLSGDGVSTIITYNGNETLSISLDPTKFKLKEVVAIGYGKVDKADLTTSVSSIEDVESINSRAVGNVGEFLQGQAPGVTVTSQGGDPSTLPQVVIRGLGTINTQSVLYIVDGLPYYGTAINPKDIKSISILKDAAAAAIYGAQGSGGVIIIETKNGKKGKPQVEINMLTGFQSVSDLPRPLTAAERNKVYTDAFNNDGSDAPIAYDATINPWGAVTRTDWMDEIFRDAAINTINGSVSGASDNINYYASLEYLNKEGVLLGTDLERYSARGKVDIDLSDKWETGINLLYSQTEAVGTNTSSGYSGTIINALYMPSSAPVYDELGNFHGTVPDDLANFAGAYGDVYNPVGQLLRPAISNPVTNFNGQSYLGFEPIKNLTFKTTFGYNRINDNYKRFNPSIPEIGKSNSENFLRQSFYTRDNWIWDNQANYNYTLNKNNLDITLVHSAQEEKVEYTYIKAKGFDSEEPYNQFLEFANEIMDKEGNKYKTRMTSAIGRLMYDYDKRYYISGSIRRDETSQANPEGDYQVGWFPSFSGAWKISNEPFFDVDAFNNLKIRGSWGKVANVNSLDAYNFTSGMSVGKVIVGDDGAWDEQGIWLSTRPSTEVTWEVSNSYDIGVDIGLFNKFSATVDYYNKTTEGMILRNTRQDHHGLNPEFINGGDVENKGVEVALNYNNIFGDFKVNVGANFATNKNEITYLSPEYTRLGNEFIPINTNVRDQLYPYANKLGEELFSYYLIPYAGIFQSQEEINAYTVNGQLVQPNAKPGDFKFTDVNGDGVINDDDRVFSGSYNPDFTYAFNFNIEYKGFDLSAFFQGVAGVDVFNAYKFAAFNPSLDFNLDSEVLNAWTPNNTNTDIPRLTHEDPNQNYTTNSTWYLEDGSYFRLKNVTLGYDFSRFLNSFANKARIYCTAENVFTITDYSGIDPEVGGIGLDNAQYPVSRTISLGATFNF